jgi:antitoxin HicB
MRSFWYPAALRRDTKGYVVSFPDLPEALTGGDNREDALAQAADCLDEAVAGRIAHARDIPKPSRLKRGQVIVSVPALMAAKAALYLAVRETGTSKAELARRLRCDEKEVRRMLNPRHATKLTRLQEALEQLGKTLVVAVDTRAA